MCVRDNGGNKNVFFFFFFLSKPQTTCKYTDGQFRFWIARRVELETFEPTRKRSEITDHVNGIKSKIRVLPKRKKNYRKNVLHTTFRDGVGKIKAQSGTVTDPQTGFLAGRKTSLFWRIINYQQLFFFSLIFIRVKLSRFTGLAIWMFSKIMVSVCDFF